MAQDEAPPSPRMILRGHRSQIHAACFIRDNERLLTGDADGYVVAWDLTIMRPRAVWRPHTNAILELTEWEPDRVITQGRDNKLIIWKLAEGDEAALQTTLPLDAAGADLPKPWMLHMLEVNTMNFCAFASLELAQRGSSDSGLLLGVPNALKEDAVDIFHIPTQRRTVTLNMGGKHGMLMALALRYIDQDLNVIAAFEDGVAVVVRLNSTASWELVYEAKCHTQPILSLDVTSSCEYFLTSSADALVVKHPLPARADQVIDLDAESAEARNDNASRHAEPSERLIEVLQMSAKAGKATAMACDAVVTKPLTIVNTKHAGQQGLRLRDDGRVVATAGWDSKARVYSSKSLKEIAVLKWHQVGCYVVAFSAISPKQAIPTPVEPQVSTLAVAQNRSTVKAQRLRHAKEAHWLAVGAKDGKVSLWDIF